MTERRFRSAVLAERRPGLAERVIGLLSTEFEAVIRVGDERSLLEIADKLAPEVVLADRSLFFGGDLRWVERLRVCCPRARLILLSDDDDPRVRTAARESGAHWFVLKGGPPEEGLTATLRGIFGGVPV